MSDDLTEQVREALTESLPEGMFGSLASALAPRIAACMRATAEEAFTWDRTMVAIDKEGAVRTVAAAGLAKLRGEP